MLQFNCISRGKCAQTRPRMLCSIPLQLRFYYLVSLTRLPLLLKQDAQKVRSNSLLFLLPQRPPLSRGCSRCFPAILTHQLFYQALSFVWRRETGSASTHVSLSFLQKKARAIAGGAIGVLCTQNDPPAVPLERASWGFPSPCIAEMEMTKPIKSGNGRPHSRATLSRG